MLKITSMKAEILLSLFLPALLPPLPASAATLGANCNCYCCSSGEDCTPVHVGTVSVGRPGDINATCTKCTATACSDAYPFHCSAPVPGAQLKGVTEPSCDAAGIVDGDACEIPDDVPWSCMIDVETALPSGERAVNSYNLQPLCKDQGYDYVDKTNAAWFNINVCGYAPKQCFPANCAADGVPASDGTKRTWEGAPCTPWDATANVGSVVRFFQSNLPPPPPHNTKGHGGQIQKSCSTDDTQIVDCTEACSIPATAMYNEIGAGVNWGIDLGVIDGFSGLVLTASGPGTAVDVADPSNPLGPNAKGGQTCQPTSEFTGGVQSASFSFVCEEGLQGAKIVRIDTTGCDYNIVMKTGAVCPESVICAPGTAVCGSGPNAGWCSTECVGLGWFWVFLLIMLSMFAIYCAVGAGMQHRATGICIIPHQRFWSNCVTCKLCCGQGAGSDGSSFQHLFGGSKPVAVPSGNGGGTNAFASMEHPDSRRSSYGTTNAYTF